MKNIFILWKMSYDPIGVIEKLFFWYKISYIELIFFLIFDKSHSTWRFRWPIKVWDVIRLYQDQEKCQSKSCCFLNDLQLMARIKNKVRFFEKLFIRLDDHGFEIFRVLLCLSEFRKYLVCELLIFVLQFETLVNAQLRDAHDFCWIAEVFEEKNTVHPVHNLESSTPHAALHCVKEIDDCRKEDHVADFVWHKQSDWKILFAVEFEFLCDFVEMYKMKDFDLFRQQIDLNQLKKMLSFKVKLFCYFDVHVENPQKILVLSWYKESGTSLSGFVD
jgi:hypothetical protein